MTRPTAPDGSPLPRRHVAHFLASVEWAGCALDDRGGRPVVRGPRAGLLQPEVDRRADAIRAWWAAVGEGER